MSAHSSASPQLTHDGRWPPSLNASTPSRAASPPILLTWEDVSYKVSMGSRGNHCEKTLLRGITGFVGSGDMLAILGPSGAGKTTLLDVLAQRKTTGRVTGRIQLNGRPATVDGLRRVSGYVQQENAMHSYLTVEETVCFAATLRTPPTVTDEEIAQRVDKVIQLLGIDHVRHRQIGSAFSRGISGGEKKRCAVAVELAAAPSLLFLDEPAASLDGFTALHLVTVLKSLAQSGVAIIFSIHQPRSSIFRLFDRVLLLNSDGEEAFFGPAQEAVPFLLATGIAPNYPANPADFLLDSVAALQADEAVLLACDLSTTAVPVSSAVAAATAPAASADTTSAATSVDATATAAYLIPPLTQGRDIAVAFTNTRLPMVRADLVERLRQVAELEAEAGQSLLSALVDEGPYFRGFGTQIRLVAVRCTRNKMRDPVATVVSCTVAMIFAVLIGSIYYQVGLTQASIRNRMGVLFFIMMNTTFSALGSLEMFLKDRSIYVREHRSGMYSAGAYYVGKIVQDVPIGIAVNFAFNLVVYLMVGLQFSLRKFLVFDLVCSLVMLDSYAMCLFMSNMSKDYAVANILSSLLLVLFLLPTGGMLVSLDSIPMVWRWIKYVSFVRYGFGAVVINEFDGLTFTCPEVEGGDDADNVTVTPAVPGLPCFTSGTAYAASQGFYVESLWPYVGATAVSVVVYLLLGYWTLRRWRSTEST